MPPCWNGRISPRSNNEKKRRAIGFLLAMMPLLIYAVSDELLLLPRGSTLLCMNAYSHREDGDIDVHIRMVAVW